ncbi:hypothetical protein L6164_003334 [Bauhinia variegata]|uniref:Uncharacterized protein n=1 Tax=Bauhinia variegata TaxID=167791 RepID=A0ACB9Q0I9_BAUVA|nr:hypothetical protein L6164_003334 [Bauhinia variegata]
MGNGIGKVCLCSTGDGTISRRYDSISIPYDRALGNSVFYTRPDAAFSGFSDYDSATQMTFRSISGASVSANSSTRPSTSLTDPLLHSFALDSMASFESSSSFTAVPLQPGLSSVGSSGTASGPMDFASGPFENGSESSVKLQKSFSNDGYVFQIKPSKPSLKKIFRRAISHTISRRRRSIVRPIKGAVLAARKSISEKNSENVNVIESVSSNQINNSNETEDDNNYEDDVGGDASMGSEIQNLHWAQGRAGEDRVHLVISDDHGWVFVGIYDGFNGPDAPDFLLDNLFYAVLNELKAKGLFYNPKTEKYPIGGDKLDLDSEWDGEKSGLEKKMTENFSYAEAISHSDVLEALSEALRKTEDAFLKTAEEMITDNAVLAMMGSCVLVMLMRGEDVYLMNVGDSRAILAQAAEYDHGLRKNSEDMNGDDIIRSSNLTSLQLTVDHSTHTEEEVQRIRREHPDDPFAISRGRVKGSLNVTRAFGAGFLKQPKHNNAVLETFKVNYIGDSPYITCSPSLHHHRLSSRHKFLILSSDGLFQYFTNEEAVSKVESFITLYPDRDPAQLLIEEVLCRAARKAGMDFHQLLDIPQGQRRIYHDDISVVIISFEGKIWCKYADS